MSIRIVRGIALCACLSVVPSWAGAQQPEAPSDRSFIKTLALDFKSLASKESVPVLSTAVALSLLAQPFDQNLTYSASCSTFLKTTFDPWARVAGQEWLLGTGALATLVTGHVMQDRKIAALGSDLIEAQIVTGVTTLTTKYAVSRTRPDGEPHSFPSGHAAGTFAAATVVQRHYGIKGAIPAYAAAVLITGARLQANSHYPTDLIMGAAIGILSGRAATFDLGSRRLQVSPAAVPGGVAVNGTIHEE